ncbi:hypothetical protein EDD17DRAFT_1763189 [Pisolithus thermaeus]|nr:hypothetical protein EDD17DRAFT_1763189 [Pisolithus thermaeus]
MDLVQDFGQKLESFKGNFKKSYESGGGSSSSTPARPTIPIHPIFQKARDRFMEVDRTVLTPPDFTHFLALLIEDAAWIQMHLEESRKLS